MKGPDGEQLHDTREKSSEKFEFIAHKKGIYHFCFGNRSPYHETIDFDVLVGHYGYVDHHAKDGRNSRFCLLWTIFSQCFILVNSY